MKYTMTFLDEERQADELDLEAEIEFEARNDKQAKEVAAYTSTRPYELTKSYPKVWVADGNIDLD